MSYFSTERSIVPPAQQTQGEVVTTPSPSNGHLGARVTVVSPDGRELMWTTRESSVAAWQVGQIVSFRNSRWQVLERRAEHADSVTLRLGPIPDFVPG